VEIIKIREGTLVMGIALIGCLFKGWIIEKEGEEIISETARKYIRNSCSL